jgi:predicted AAA+ superfamily ATPase
LPDAFVNLFRPDVHRELLARPERLRDLVRGNADRQDIVMDEVQRAPELLHVVHDRIEEGPARRFVFTGSSAWKLRRGSVDLLVGRAVVKTLRSRSACCCTVVADRLEIDVA